MIQNTDAVFPNNVVKLLSTRFRVIDPDLYILNRPLRAEDPTQCVGIYESLWTPNED